MELRQSCNGDGNGNVKSVGRGLRGLNGETAGYCNDNRKDFVNGNGEPTN